MLMTTSSVYQRVTVTLVRTIKLDERLEPGNNELIWFPNTPFRPLMEKSKRTCAFPAKLRKAL